MVEHAELERKGTLDLDAPFDRVKLVREVAAMMNAGGGRIVLGVSDDGAEVGLDVELANKLDPARLGDLMDSFISPDRVEIAVEIRKTTADRVVVELTVPAALEPPVVLCKSGNYVGEDGKQAQHFAAHSVYVRRSTKAEPARWEDYRRWREDAIQRARDEIIARLTMIVEAPSDSRIRVISDDEVRDEPNFFLSRSVDVFRHRPERLLSGSDLAYLWLHRGALQFDETAAELIFHSALRKRATLWLWLATLGLGADVVERFLDRSLELRDRDKSDAARSMLQVAAVFLDDTAYQRIRAELAASGYAHMREAAEALPDRSATLEALGSHDSVAPDGRSLAALTVDELTRLAQQQLSETDQVISRRLPLIGWEYLSRTLHPERL